MEEAFLIVLDPSSVQIVYVMRSISKSEVRVLTGRDCDPRCVGVECVSGLAHCAGRRTILLILPQQGTSRCMIGRRRQMYGILDTNHRSCCSIVKYYPIFLPMVAYLPYCVKKMRYLLGEFGYDMSRPSPIMVDNASAIQVAKHPEHQSTMKHVHRAYHWIRDHVEQGALKINHVPGVEIESGGHIHETTGKSEVLEIPGDAGFTGLGSVSFLGSCYGLVSFLIHSYGGLSSLLRSRGLCWRSSSPILSLFVLPLC